MEEELGGLSPYRSLLSWSKEGVDMPISSTLQRALSREEVDIDNLYLDPENPRLAYHRTPREHERAMQDSVQDDIIDTLYDGSFAMDEIEESIRYNGYVGTDVIVVRPVSDEPEDETDDRNYVVVEGNRRLAAIKRLLNKYEENTPPELEDRIEELQRLEVLVADLDELDDPETDLAILQGLRHISGTKEWGPYQQARVIEQLHDRGLDLNEIESRLGLSTTMVKRYRRAYGAVIQFKEDDEYGEQWNPNLFSFFEEAIKRPDVREWLEWDDDSYTFSNNIRRRQFYKWFLGDEDGHRKITRAIDVRRLSEIIAYDDKNKHLQKLKNQDETTVEGIYAQIEAEREKLSLLEMDWERELREMQEKLNSLPASYIADMGEEELERLQELREQIEETLSYSDVLQE